MSHQEVMLAQEEQEKKKKFKEISGREKLRDTLLLLHHLYMSTACVLRQSPCHDVKTLMDWTRLCGNIFLRPFNFSSLFFFRLLLNFKEKVHSFISSSFIFFFLLLVASLSARPSRIFCHVSFWKDNFSLTLSKSQSLTFFSLNFSTYFLPFFHF